MLKHHSRVVMIAGRNRVDYSFNAGQGYEMSVLHASHFVRDDLLLAGSDVPCGAVPPGLSLWRELSLLVEAGLSPTQALRTATSAAATFMGQSQLGRLLPGSAVDLVLVRGNPMERIPERPDIALVIRHGTVYRPDDLLAAAETAASTLREEPWGLQFALHRAGSAAPGKS